MLKGFIDLLLEHEGRYYVVDYTSRTGWVPTMPPTTARRCVKRCSRRAYELQYVLYLLALHRLLRVRLPGYD